ncbi:sugar-specific permease SgaT/UlaA [Enterobacteriaceae bacterium ESL0689]|nr:sugar-specific permease SgaT/UlaA [Enterobacteriaceae bacterium ESL0689]
MLQFIVGLLQDASILVSIFTIVGNIALKKSFNDIIVSAVKTYLGFTLLFAGASLMISPALKSFSKIFVSAFSINGVIPSNEVVVVEAMQKLGHVYTSAIAIGLIGAMLLNILLARLTPLKFIVLSGHHIFFMVSCLTIICMLHQYSIYTSAFIATVITGCWCVISPAMLMKYCREIKKCDELRKSGDFSIGQFGSISYFLAGLLGKMFGNKKNDIESISIPNSIGFLKDKQVSTFLLMLLFFVISTLIAGTENIQGSVANRGHNFNIVIYLFKQAGMFAAGVYVLTRGVSMFIEQLMPAFKGISNKIVKNSIPAVEIFSLFPYSSNAVFIGFVCCTLSGFLTMIALPFLGYPVIIPSLLFTFASGGGSAIIGNATGGIRGAIIGSVICGIISTAGSALLFQPLQDAGVDSPTVYSTTDFTLLGNTLNGILSLFR